MEIFITLHGVQYVAYPRESWLGNETCSVCHTMLGTPQMRSVGNTLFLPEDAPRPYTAWPTSAPGSWLSICCACVARAKE